MPMAPDLASLYACAHHRYTALAHCRACVRPLASRTVAAGRLQGPQAMHTTVTACCCAQPVVQARQARLSCLLISYRDLVGMSSRL